MANIELMEIIENRVLLRLSAMNADIDYCQPFQDEVYIR